ncbi:MAG: hypothetical protein KAJ49_03080 [Arcobacteraceae bacterium]|nr:hypothetical protein [Arcobacteraceae bacterium]
MSHYAGKIVNGKVYVDMKINLEYSSHSMFAKETLIKELYKGLDVVIVSKPKLANVIFHTSLKVKEKSISKDTQGYVSVYKEEVSILITYLDLRKKNHNVTVSSYAFFTVDSDSSVTKENKDKAINIAISKALTDIFSKMAINSFK